MKRYRVPVSFADWDIGALRMVLADAIAQVERRLADHPPPINEATRAYLAQLKGCRRAVEVGIARSLTAARRAGARKERRRWSVRLSTADPDMGAKAMIALSQGRRVSIDCGTIRGKAKPEEPEA